MNSIFKLSLFILLITSGCSSVQVFSDYDRSINFNKYKSFAWLQRSDSVKNYWYDNQIIEHNVINLSNNELQARGYKADLQNPDLLIEYHISTKKAHYTVSNPIYSNTTYQYNPTYNNNYNNNGAGYNINRPYGYNNTPYIVGYNQRQVEYTEGTLLIDIIERSSNQLIWRGWSVGTVTDESDLESQLKTDIHKIFQSYPVPLPVKK